VFGEGRVRRGDVAVIGPVDAASSTTRVRPRPARPSRPTRSATRPTHAQRSTRRTASPVRRDHSTRAGRPCRAVTARARLCGPDAGSVTDCLARRRCSRRPDTEQKKLATELLRGVPHRWLELRGQLLQQTIADDAGNIGLGATLGLTFISRRDDHDDRFVVCQHLMGGCKTAASRLPRAPGRSSTRLAHPARCR